jgi:N-methylhydantoinase A
MELGVAEILIPSGPGILCAFGVLTKDIAMDLSASRILRDTDERFAARVRGVFDELESRAQCQLAESGANLATLSFAHSVDARYFGQNFELPIGVELGDACLREQVRARFHDAHRRIYGYAQETGELELVTFRLRAALAAARPRVSPGAAAEQAGHSCKPHGRRSVLFDEADWPVPCDVYDRSAHAPGHRMTGPADIEQMDTTTIVPPGFVAAVDPIGNLHLSRGGSGA